MVQARLEIGSQTKDLCLEVEFSACGCYCNEPGTRAKLFPGWVMGQGLCRCRYRFIPGKCQRRERLQTMRLKIWLLVGAVASVLVSVAYQSEVQAKASSQDWKFYGGVSSPNGQTWCFYDARSVAREPAGLVQVAAKCLPQADMDDIDITTDFGGAIARNAARKRHVHYMPPYALAESLDRAQAADIARLEEIADIADVEPRVRISYELDCSKHLVRRLNLYVKVNGKVRTVERPADWKPISPSENSIRLSRILCRPRADSVPRSPTRPQAVPTSASSSTG
jgi:hypothetical protein